ncbi:hypothetical protein E4T82_00160 [Streptococcus cuniculi]|uniref:Uncharacterized protein n=1 Tax=Streptococcus cuniculi TaxID=1432788 RepID=A0A4Y9JFK1_9STRE|nr:hypothetical protein [Streptococcus cuniculi]TFU98759.1 hypothetical protein E4T82_00160 [Streptococcus cuniculi]
MKALSKVALKKRLMALEKEELVGLIGQLYGESEVVKGKLNVSFQGEGYVADLVADYCRKIHRVMFPDNLLSGGHSIKLPRGCLLSSRSVAQSKRRKLECIFNLHWMGRGLRILVGICQ